MKGLIYKKFASSGAGLLIVITIFVVSALFSLFGDVESNGIAFSVDTYMILMVFLIIRNIDGSDKASWESYARALPCKAYQRVGAEYIFSLILFAGVSVAFASVSAISRLQGQTVNFGERFLNWCENELVIYLFYLLTLALATAFVLPIKYVMKKSAGRSILMGMLYAPPFFTLVFLVLFDALGGYNNLTEALIKPEFAGLFALVTFSLYAASFCISVIAETKTEKEKLKSVKVCAATALALTVVFSVFTVGYLAKEGALTKTGTSVFDVADRYEDFVSEYTTYAN